MSSIKQYIVTLKETSSDKEVSDIKKQISSLGGEITNEFSLIKGFTAKLPEVHSESIKGHGSVHSIEEDKEVHIS
ncbi:protease B inhibitor 2 [[Candida] jaroonii]|uniref:Protease B inhibitor 2 n=1 Tax=[Candida] jaroonii TaxID=467808 RepID=A0ACA9YFD4_9ASCO|nr:protease B inhibitor 2 [[Candida] jaroonii]